MNPLDLWMRNMGRMPVGFIHLMIIELYHFLPGKYPQLMNPSRKPIPQICFSEPFQLL